MALSRAFTKKEKGDKDSTPSRSFFSSKPAPSIRNKISSPLALISTTNQLAYNAPDLFPSSNSSTPVSATSKGFAPLTLSTSIGTPLSDQDEVPDLLHSNSSTPDSSTRGSTPTSTEPNHLSGYFAAAVEEKRKSDEQPQRSLSRAGKVGELLGRKRSESRVRSPSGSLGHGAARKPSLQSIDSTGLKSANSSGWNTSATSQKSAASTPQFAPAPFSSSKNSSPTGATFSPAPFNSAPKSAGLAPSGGGLMRKGTIRARGSVDMFSPNMGVTPEQHGDTKSKPSISNLRERRAEDSKPRNGGAPEQDKLTTVKPSNGSKDRQISQPRPLEDRSQDRRGPISPRAAASSADLRGQAQGERHPALRAKASLNIRPSIADKITPPARSFTTGGERGMERGMRKASPIDEAMATLDEVAKDFNVERQVKREEKKSARTIATSHQPRSDAKPKTRIIDGEPTIMGVDCERFTAVDYMSEIQDLTEFLFPELRHRREAGDRAKGRGMAGVVEVAQMQQYNMI